MMISDYSCALVADILLQGYLYITENHFAFYSNVFGYVTKVSPLQIHLRVFNRDLVVKLTNSLYFRY